MKLKIIKTVVLSLLAASQIVSIRGADVSRFFLVKGQDYDQTNATTVLSDTNQKPFRFTSSVEGSATDSVLSASVKLPNTQVRLLTNDSGSFDFEKGFTNKTSLDAAYGAGNYIFTIVGQNDGTNKPALALTTDNYPTVPKVANWDDLQAVEALQPLDISWSAFTNGSAADAILVDISAADGSVVATTPALLTSNALSGTSLTAELPAGILNDATIYEGRLLFVKRTSLTTNYPGAKGLAGYFRQTTFPVVTLPTPPSNGRIQFSAQNYSALENSDQAAIIVTRSGFSGAVAVDFATQDGSARDGRDYLGFSQTINFADGQSNQTVFVPLINNYLLDGNRTVNLWLTNPQGGAILGGRTNSVLTILDDEIATAGKIQFAARSNSVPEASKFVTLTLNRIGGSKGTVSVDYLTHDGTAFNGLNYLGTNGTAVFGPGVVSKTITIPILNDSLYQSNEVFTVSLVSTAGGAAFGTNTITTVGIVNNDFGGTFAFKQSTYTTNENSTNFVVTVVRTGGAASGVTVDFATADGTAQAGVRYVATNGTLFFGSNELSKTFLVGVINDAIPNGNQNFFVALANATGGAKVSTNATANTATLTVLDDESSVAFTNTSFTVNEKIGRLNVTVVRTGVLLTPVSVDFSTADLTGFAGINYRATNGTLIFAPNVKSKSFSVIISNDTLVNPDKTFLLRLTNPTNGVQLGAQSNVVVTITNDNLGGAIQFAASSFSGTQGGNAAIKITRTGGAASGVTADFAMSGGTAIAGTDYTNGSQTITFNAGETNKIILIALPFNTLNTTSRTVNLALSKFTGGSSPGAITTSILTIQNKPDVNAVPITGPVFMSATLGTTAVNITPNNAGNAVNGVAGTGFKLQVNWFNGSLNIFDFEGVPFATGTTQMDNSGNNGIMLYTKTGLTGGNPQIWAVANGSAAVGSHGTVTIDAIDTSTKTVSGRFTFQAIGDTGTTPTVLEVTNGKFRTHYN